MTKEIEKEFKCGKMSYIDAILKLQTIDYSSIEAEKLVEKWEKEMESEV